MTSTHSETIGRSVDPSDIVDFASVFVEQVRTRNFRGLSDCTVELESDLTVLVGRNNAGKSRILRALAVALSAVPSDRDDLTADGSDHADVDVVLAPAPSTGDDTFEPRAARRLGNLIQRTSSDPVHERVAWRATIQRSLEGLGVRDAHTSLQFDESTGDWLAPSNATTLTYEQRTIIAAILVDTRRDLVEEMAQRGSAIRRVLDDLEIEPEHRTEVEDQLGALGQLIVSSSLSLEALKAALESLWKAVDSVGRPSLEPLPARLEDLARAISIEFDTGGGSLPLRFHGAGVRSLASLQVQNLLYDRRLGRDGPALRPHPVSLIEEPESHLHPQAQFELPLLLSSIRGQKIVTTHSTHLASVVEPRSLRILQPIGSETIVRDLRPASEVTDETPRARRPAMYAAEMEKLRRMIERPFGELLFASAIVIGDGATERAFLPPVIREAFSTRAHGVSVVDPGSLASEYAIAIVKFARLMEIPWLLFCDSDDSGQGAVERLIHEHGGGDAARAIFVNGVAGSSDGIALERMLVEFDEDLCIEACTSIGFDRASDEPVLDFMKRHKGATGRFLAGELIDRYPCPDALTDSVRRWPQSLCELATSLDRILPSREI